MKRTFLALFILVFMFSMVSAVKPITQVNTGTDGLQIFYPEYTYVPQNTDFKLHLHVSNLSNGVQFSNTVVDCYLHLYNTTGHHTFESPALTKDANGFDHEILITMGNFTDAGVHGYFIWCNQTGLGGEAKGVFTVTESGEEPTIQSAIVYGIILFVTLILFIAGMLWFSSLRWEHYKDNEDNIIQVSHDRTLKTILFFACYIALVFLFFIAKVMVESMMITNNTHTVINAFFLILLSGLAPITLAVVVLAIVTTIGDSKLQNAIMRGF